MNQLVCQKCNRAVEYIGIIDFEISKDANTLVGVCAEHLEELYDARVCDMIIDKESFLYINHHPDDVITLRQVGMILTIATVGVS